MALATASYTAAGLATGKGILPRPTPGQRTAPAASPLRGRRLVSIAAYWRSVSDLLSSGEFPPIWQCFHNLSIRQYQCHKRLPPCSHPDRPIPPPAQRLRDPCLCESEATSKYLIEIAL
jgi:hypothetical protein